MPIDLEWAVPETIPGLEKLLNRVADACFSLEGLEAMHMSVRIVDGDAIRCLNRTMRGIDRETDVLSFPAVRYRPGTTARDNPKKLRREFDPSIGQIHLGDCAISLPRAREQAAEYGHSLERELGYLTAHSALHLMGYDHMTDVDKRKMRNLEERAMDMVSLRREGETTMCDQDLFDRACAALKNAYVPYSDFRVGACLLAEDGRTFSGCNIENASYGATICAERCAVSAAVASGARKFTAIAIAGEKAQPWPCGICRQVLNEFSSDMHVICGQLNGGYDVVSLRELLPHSFGPNALNGGEEFGK